MMETHAVFVDRATSQPGSVDLSRRGHRRLRTFEFEKRAILANSASDARAEARRSCVNRQWRICPYRNVLNVSGDATAIWSTKESTYRRSDFRE